MKVAMTSDLHGHLPPVLECDILVIAGDVCPTVSHKLDFQEQWLLHDFKNWLDGIDAEKVLIAGNHDFVMESRPYVLRKLPVHYLCVSGEEVCGLKFFGIPWTPWFGGWAFNADEDGMKWACNQIPEGLDFLVTHGPAALSFGPSNGITLEGVDAGCPQLTSAIWDKKPKRHVCGHIHEGSGINFRRGGTDFYNVSYLDRNYRPTNTIVVIDV